MRTRSAILLSVAGLIAAAAGAAVWQGLRLGGPHLLGRPRAMLSDSLRTEVRDAVRALPPRSIDEAIERSLTVSDRVLRYGRGHEPSLDFDTFPRVARSEEYAQLFARVLEVALRESRQEALVLVVRSDRPHAYGYRIPSDYLRSHDWVLVEQRRGKDDWQRWYVDPTLHDLVGHWSLAERVDEPVRVLR
ncbi:MAG: hypothetical protein L0Y66_06685 [Myxococcaceae bacterium]|nr:hypothetical protein [Myxococcaceae bacterium]MCI0669575.1 hypothetical protein [Myxococcaceae bacterium]